MKQADTQRHNLYQSQIERKKMTTLNGNKIIGYDREANLSVTIFTESPTGDSTDSLQFAITFDSIGYANELESMLSRIFAHEQLMVRVNNGTAY